jgi:leader peptidase (prepilin peptidase)/N-methyltransferase
MWFPITLLFALFGAIIGSFLNVLVLRHGVKTILGRSACASCGHELETVDLVPIISWLALLGKCRFCGSKISVQYPLVEASTALLFGLIGAAPIALPLQLLGLPILALLVAISAYDVRHGIIPDAWAYSFAFLSLVFSLAYLTSLHQLSAFAPLFLAGPASALPFAALWFVSGGRAMGLGDAKLAWGVGWLLGPLYAFVGIVFAFVLGAFISVCILLPLSSPGFWKFLRRFTPTATSRKLSWGFTMKSEVAFGPFLATACLIVWFILLFGHDPLAYIGVSLG